MQTFLPFADFSESAASLDVPRLGKQRVEALQVLRAIVIPSYGWQSHPAMQMWRGYVPALTKYALAMVDAWTALGHADSTRQQIAEFAPEADHTPLSGLAVPSWLGNEQLHLSHQSNLVRKFPEFYGALFPGVPDDLPYVWPGPDPLPAVTPLVGTTLWVARPRSEAEFSEWMDTGAITLGESSPRGKQTAAWAAQLDALSALEVGDPVAAIDPSSAMLRTGTVSGEIGAYRRDDAEAGLLRPVDWAGERARASFHYPALLQDPRSLFALTLPG